MRAGIVDHSGKYRWSSYTYNVDGVANRFTLSHSEYRGLGRTVADRRVTYRALFLVHVEPDISDKIRRCVTHGLPLGAGRSKMEIEVMLGRRVPDRGPGRPRKEKVDEQVECSK